jgi:FKBP-type peptidyl-prolyl cis-trans isomerase 2
MTTEAQQNDTVKVHYTGKLSDGTVFDSSREREPLEFQLGQGQVIPGFEEAVIGMNPGETKTATLAPDDAYGQHRDDMVTDVSRSDLPEDLKPEVGQQLQARNSAGQTIPVRVVDVGDESVKLDANHPLAGQTLTFDIELVDVAK